MIRRLITLGAAPVQPDDAPQVWLRGAFRQIGAASIRVTTGEQRTCGRVQATAVFIRPPRGGPARDADAGLSWRFRSHTPVPSNTHGDRGDSNNATAGQQLCAELRTVFTLSPQARWYRKSDGNAVDGVPCNELTHHAMCDEIGRATCQPDWNRPGESEKVARLKAGTLSCVGRSGN